jgi:hypothetical protein
MFYKYDTVAAQAVKYVFLRLTNEKVPTPFQGLISFGDSQGMISGVVNFCYLKTLLALVLYLY